MIRNKLFILFILLFKLSFCINTDSLQKAFNNLSDDTVKINYIINYFNSHYYTHPDLVKKYSYYTADLSKKLNFDEGELKSYSSLLAVNYILEKYDSCIYYYEKINSIKNNHLFPDLMADINNNIGIVYKELNQNDKAIEFYTKSAEYYLKNKDSIGYYVTRSNIGQMLSLKGNYKEEEKILNEAINYFARIKQDYCLANTLRYLSDNQNNQYKPEEAEKTIRKSITLALQMQDSFLLYSNYSALSRYLFSQKRYSEATDYALKGINFQKRNGKYCFVSIDFLTVANNLISSKKYNDAIPYLDSALHYNQTYCNIGLNTEMIIYESYSKIYDSLRQFEKAYLYYIKFKAISDSINKTSNNRVVAELQEKYLTKEKENEIKLKDAKLAEEQKIKMYIILSFGLIILIIILFISRYRAKQKTILQNQKIIAEKNKAQMEKELIELEQKLLLTQMNPHFIFNSLNSIRAFITKNEGFKASEYLGDFAKLMRLILESSRKKLITIEDEIKILEYYLKLEQVRNQNRFDYTINKDESIEEEIDRYKIPPMLIQPFIENAIHHGIQNSDTKGLITINFYELNDTEIQVEIIDNGIGRKNAQQLKDKLGVQHESFALKITEERLQHLSNELHKPISYAIIDLEKGTKVTFIIPIFT